MLEAVKGLGGQRTALVVGTRALADKAAALGFERVLFLETAPGVPAEAYAPQAATAVKSVAPALIMSSDAAAARILLGSAAAGLDAALISAVSAIKAEGGELIASRSTADGKLLEDIEVKGALAVIYDGADVEIAPSAPAPIEAIPIATPGGTLTLREVLESGESAGMLTATRVVSGGMGLMKKDNVQLLEALAKAMKAEIACTLPACDDMRWFTSSQVVGSSHHQIAPEIYIAVGISGQPQHMSGIRDAKIIVAVNNDPDARIFKNCHYGIIGDMNEIVPALTEAFQNQVTS
jgi:electron transfer flavoprotein alpha subunit